jgi:hypothetical protein
MDELDVRQPQRTIEWIPHVSTQEELQKVTTKPILVKEDSIMNLVSWEYR